MNPFTFLEIEEVNESTKNPQRKLAKMKRRYSEKPSQDLKSRIDEMDQRLNPKFKKKKKKKKKKVDIDLETEYQKNRAYWQEYRKNRSEEEKVKEEKERRNRKESEDREDRRRYEESQTNSFEVDNETLNILPIDIRSFLNSDPDKKTYNTLCKRYHPDKGGDQEMFKIINNHMNR
jgi:hypothetical protein